MIVNEIFTSIEGEGKRAGELCTFIRLAGCNLACSYCDTEYAQCQHDGKEMCVLEILETVCEIGVKNITITGGEPLIHKDIEDLIAAFTPDFEINIETNGSIPITKYKISPFYSSNLFFTMDYKCESSGMNNHMKKSNFYDLRKDDVLKFVVGSRQDLEQCLQFKSYSCHKYLSPVFGKIEPKEIIEFMKEHNLQDFKVQLQLHKFIYPVEMRGV